VLAFLGALAIHYSGNFSDSFQQFFQVPNVFDLGVESAAELAAFRNRARGIDDAFKASKFVQYFRQYSGLVVGANQYFHAIGLFGELFLVYFDSFAGGNPLGVFTILLMNNDFSFGGFDCNNRVSGQWVAALGQQWLEPVLFGWQKLFFGLFEIGLFYLQCLPNFALGFVGYCKR
jgi:hypothetical protein